MNEPNSSKQSLTDWQALEQMPDDEINFSDIHPLDENFFAQASLRTPEAPKVTISMQVDRDVLDWFLAQESWEHLIQAALRIYAEAHKRS